MLVITIINKLQHCTCTRVLPHTRTPCKLYRISHWLFLIVTITFHLLAMSLHLLLNRYYFPTALVLWTGSLSNLELYFLEAECFYKIFMLSINYNFFDGINDFLTSLFIYCLCLYFQCVHLCNSSREQYLIIT